VKQPQFHHAQGTDQILIGPVKFVSSERASTVHERLLKIDTNGQPILLNEPREYPYPYLTASVPHKNIRIASALDFLSENPNGVVRELPRHTRRQTIILNCDEKDRFVPWLF
jgi:hypothetical protein